MFDLNTQQELEQTLQSLNAKLDDLNQNAVRDRRCDFETMDQSELSFVLKNKTNPQQKKALLLTQIGYIRINLFMEYYVRLQIAQETGDLDDAVRLMKDYAEAVAIPFLVAEAEKEKSKAKRIIWKLTMRKIPDLLSYVNDWIKSYNIWLKHRGNTNLSTNQKELKSDFEAVKRSFTALYTYSFSPDNFPPVANERTDR